MTSTVIDHAIAIPTKQNNVWEYLSNVENFPLWQEDIESISFLTTKHSGRGTRYRAITRHNNALVIEFTAWYEGLGFEYVIVDGVSYDNNRGRVRLQESTEGTIVQWTFSYELSGFLSGLRNSLTVKRNIDNEIIDNLRNLYTFVREKRGEEQFVPEEAKSYLKEAPDVLARSQYEPRYPSKSETKLSNVEQEISEPAQPDYSMFEPPVAEGDTKPNPSVQSQAEVEVDSQPMSSSTMEEASLSEPTFLKDMPAFDKQPPKVESKPEPLPIFEDSEVITEAVTVPTPTSSGDESIPEPEVESVDIPSVPQPTTDESNVSPVTESQPNAKTSVEQSPTITDDYDHIDINEVDTGELGGLPSTSITDTARVSVFEIFGLPKPSETEQLSSSKEDSPPQLEEPSSSPMLEEPPIIEANTEQIRAFTDLEPIIPDVLPDLTASRRGLRATMRHKQTRVRRPK